MKLYHVYVLASLRRVLYIGITGDFAKRIPEHKAHKYPRSFTSQYNVTRLVYFEEFTQVDQAIRAGEAVERMEAVEESGVDRANESALERPKRVREARFSRPPPARVPRLRSG